MRLVLDTPSRSLLVLFLLWFACDEVHASPINAVLGDASWRAGHSGSPEAADEVTRIRAHLGFVLARLRARDVSSLPIAAQRARSSSLVDLEQYTERGLFPCRTGDSFAGRRPRFIDDRGVHCAVGQLIADSGEPDLARAIDARNEYAYVVEMREPELSRWATSRGFTVEELAMIQPAYGIEDEPPTPASAEQSIRKSRDAITLKCAQRHEPMSKIPVHVASDDGGRMTLTTLRAEPFAQCFVREASRIESGSRMFFETPKSFQFDMEVAILPPQQLLKQRLLAFADEHPYSCAPRPGPLVHEVTIAITSSPNELVAHVTTTPQNDETARCIEYRASGFFTEFNGNVLSLRAEHRFKLLPLVRDIDDLVRDWGRSSATDCEPTPPKGATARITVTARPDDTRFTIVVSGSESFAACVSKKLQAQLISQFSVERALPGGKSEVYFRIDNRVRSSVTIQLESKARRDRFLRKQRKNRDRWERDWVD